MAPELITAPEKQQISIDEADRLLREESRLAGRAINGVDWDGREILRLLAPKS